MLQRSGIHPPVPAEPFSPNDLRRKLHLLSQEVRFAIFFLLLREGMALKREDIATRIDIPPEKLHHHLYALLKENILVCDRNADAVPVFQLNDAFVTATRHLFDLAAAHLS